MFRPLVLLLCVTLVSQARAHGVRGFENGLWYDGNAFVAGTWYAVDGVLQRQAPAGATVETLDLHGGYVIPAMGNAHRHGLTHEFDTENTQLLSRGVFYVSNPNSILSFTRAARQRASLAETVDVRYSNGGLTSPGGHPTQIYDPLAQRLREVLPHGMDGEAYVTIADRGDFDRRWPEILGGEPDLLKLYLERGEHHAARHDDPAFVGKRGLDPQLIEPIVARAHAQGLRVSVHVTSAFDFHTAVAAGADEIAHLPLERIDAADAELAARRSTVVVTTVLSHRPHDDVPDLDALHTANLELLRDAGVRLVLGTDSQASVLDEARSIARLGVFDDATLVRMLVRDTPQWIFPQRRLGVLEPGAEANFVVLERDPLLDLGALSEVAMVVKNGHVLDLQAPEAKPGIAQSLGHVVMSQGVEAAIAEYHRRRQEESDAWDFSEPQLNALGYAMLQHRNVEGALAIFRLNTEMFPEGFNTWDSLAEAQLAAGDTTAAIANYRKSLELNHGNHNARKQLHGLGVTQ